MNTHHWLYRLSRAYLIGVALGGALLSLTLIHPLAQAGTGLALGVCAWTWLQNRSENNNIKR
ncbi:hypothetical protein CMI37_39475 [Candidatus Pacearchaeota archaeon]|nr:hypothetical protein [Candidatus Pacearchaeota archaeon]